MNFSNLFPDLAHIGIAYTTTLDEKHEIQYEIGLEDFIAIQISMENQLQRLIISKTLEVKKKHWNF